MDQRVQLIADYAEGESIAALARIYSVARKTIYKWLARHKAEGMAGLTDRSRIPQHCPGKVSDELIALIVTARQRWNRGPRKLRVKLAAAHPHMVWPAESTIGEILKRAGLTHRRKLRVRTPPYGQPFASVASVPMLAAVGAPSTLAVETAHRFNMTLAGFLRDDRFNIYAGPERILTDSPPV